MTPFCGELVCQHFKEPGCLQGEVIKQWLAVRQTKPSDTVPVAEHDFSKVFAKSCGGGGGRL
jgi:hypothetical protein